VDVLLQHKMDGGVRAVRNGCINSRARVFPQNRRESAVLWHHYGNSLHQFLKLNLCKLPLLYAYFGLFPKYGPQTSHNWAHDVRMLPGYFSDYVYTVSLQRNKGGEEILCRAR
jgi:hypothetical protein